MDEVVSKDYKDLNLDNVKKALCVKRRTYEKRRYLDKNGLIPNFSKLGGYGRANGAGYCEASQPGVDNFIKYLPLYTL